MKYCTLQSPQGVAEEVSACLVQQINGLHCDLPKLGIKTFLHNRLLPLG